MSERMLYVEVIRQAMNDAFMKLPKKTSKTFKYESNAKQEAIDWFNEDNPDFQVICQEAEVDTSDIIRAFKHHQKIGTSIADVPDLYFKENKPNRSLSMRI